MTAPRLHVVYRSHGGENRKQRPGYYSKLLGLASVVRALEATAAAVDVWWINDGPIPADRVALMRRTGRIVPLHGGSNRRSYRATLRQAARQGWADDDIVWFAEDDYLYGLDAFTQLAAIGAALPDAAYFSMWGYHALDPDRPPTAPAPRALPLSLGDPQRVSIDEVHWYRGVSTTSTFGVRAGVLRADLRLLRLLPYTGGAWDHTTCLAVQGLQPFSWPQVRAELAPMRHEPVGRWPRSVALGLTHLAANVSSQRRLPYGRTLVSSDPELIFHMEHPADPTGRDWVAFAEQTRQWAVDGGIPVDAPAGR